jgi:predicted nucleotidyltransferase
VSFEIREEEEIQRKYKQGHSRKKNRLIGKGGNRDTGGGKGHSRPSMTRSKSAPAGYGGLEEQTPAAKSKEFDFTLAEPADEDIIIEPELDPPPTPAPAPVSTTPPKPADQGDLADAELEARNVERLRARGILPPAPPSDIPGADAAVDVGLSTLAEPEPYSPEWEAPISTPEPRPETPEDYEDPIVVDQHRQGVSLQDYYAKHDLGSVWDGDSEDKKQMKAIARGANKKYKLPAGLMSQLVTQESDFNPNIMSHMGAVGLGQFMPGAGLDYGLVQPSAAAEKRWRAARSAAAQLPDEEISAAKRAADDALMRDPDTIDLRKDPIANANASARMMKNLLKRYNGDVATAAASYNWGGGNVRKLMRKEGATSVLDPKVFHRLPPNTRKYVADLAKVGRYEMPPEKPTQLAQAPTAARADIAADESPEPAAPRPQTQWEIYQDRQRRKEKESRMQEATRKTGVGAKKIKIKIRSRRLLKEGSAAAASGLSRDEFERASKGEVIVEPEPDRKRVVFSPEEGSTIVADRPPARPPKPADQADLTDAELEARNIERLTARGVLSPPSAPPAPSQQPADPLPAGRLVGPAPFPSTPTSPATLPYQPEDWQDDYGSPMPGGKPTRAFHLKPKPHPIRKGKKPHYGADTGRYWDKGKWKKALEDEDLTPMGTLSAAEKQELSQRHGQPRKIQVPGKPPWVKERPLGPVLPPEMVDPARIEREAWRSRLKAKAPSNMEIIAVRPSSKTGGKTGYGNQVVGRFCDKGTGKCYHTSFNHLKSLPDLEVGQRLKSGDVIGRMGSTGQSTAPHLHHELWEEPDDYLETGDVPLTRRKKNIAWTDFIEDAKQRKIKRKKEESEQLMKDAGLSPEQIASDRPWKKRNPYLRERRQRATGGSTLNKIKIKIRPAGGKLITSFEVQPNLNPEIWEGNRMRPEIGERLRKIAEEFIEKLDLTNVEIKDIILTGSLANYNWSAYSDLDVHIVVDFRDIAEDEGLVKKYFDAVRANWNRKHDIKLKGFEVELYVQDDDESHTSTGVYSLLTDKWVLRPSRKQREIDKINIFKKARHIMRDIDKVESRLGRQEYDDAVELGQQIKNKIKRMRQTGLERGGIYSTENLAFKVLRRGGYMGKLLDAVGDAYDAQRSLAEQE